MGKEAKVTIRFEGTGRYAWWWLSLHLTCARDGDMGMAGLWHVDFLAVSRRARNPDSFLGPLTRVMQMAHFLASL